MGPRFHYFGNPSLAVSFPRIGIVGTREPSPPSLAAMEALSSSLALAGAVVVSGAARGTDMAGHRGALSAGGGTIACVPQGLSRLPTKWRREFESLPDPELLLLVSPFTPTQKLTRQTPPIRNRLIASFCQALVVGEARLSSGTNICMSFALKLGRPVFFLRARSDADAQLISAQAALAARGAIGFDLDSAYDEKLTRRILSAAVEFAKASESIKAAQLRLFPGEL